MPTTVAKQAAPVPIATGWAGSVSKSRADAIKRRINAHVEWLEQPEQAEQVQFYEELLADGNATEVADEKVFDYEKMGLLKTNEDVPVYPDLNSFMIRPPQRRVETPFWPHPGMKKQVVTDPPMMAPLYRKEVEDMYDQIKGGLFNLNERDPKGRDYLPDDLLAQYARLARERSVDFSKHPQRHAIYQRIGEQLANLDVDFTGEKIKAFFRKTMPFGPTGHPSEVTLGEMEEAAPWLKGKSEEDVSKMMKAAEAEEGTEMNFGMSGGGPLTGTRGFETWKAARKNAKIHYLMGLVGEGVGSAETIGSFAGIFGGGIAMYSSLTKRGLTTFFGNTRVQKVNSLIATMGAEATIDLAYNKDGYSMVMGALLDDRQNRLLSALDAVLLGTAFGLATDAARVFKGKTPRQAVDELIERVSPEEARTIKKLKARLEEGVDPPTAREKVKHPSALAKDEPSAPRGADEDVLDEIIPIFEKNVYVDEHALDEAIAALERRIAAQPKGTETWKWKKKLTRYRGIKEFQTNDDSLRLLEHDVKAKQAASLEIDAINPQVTDDAAKIKAADDVWTEQDLLDLKALEDTAGVLPQNVSRSFVKQALRHLKTKDEWNNLASHLGFGAATGTAIASMSDDDRELAGFMMGFALPLGSGHRFKSWGGEVIRKGFRAYHEYVPKSAIAKGLSKTFVPFNYQLKRLSKRVWMMENMHSMKTQVQTYKRMEKAHGFFSHLNDYVRRGIITKAEKEELYWSLRNGATKQFRDKFTGKLNEELMAHRLMDKFDYNGIERGILDPEIRGITRRYFDEFESVFRGMGKEADKMGLISGITKNYFPRSIHPDKYKAFMKDAGIASDSRIGNAIKQEEKALRRKLTPYEEAVLANEVIKTFGYAKKGSKPSFTQQRVYGKVPPHMEKYYDSFEESSIKYVMNMTDYINNSRFLGVGLTKNRLRSIINPNEAKAVEMKAAEFVEAEVAAGRVLSEDSAAMIKQLVKEGKANLKPSLKTRTPKVGGKYNYRDSIGAALSEMAKKGHVRPEAVDWLTELLHKRYATPNGRPAWKWVRGLRDISYMMALGNPYSTLTQLSDTALTASLGARGWMEGNVYEAALNRLTGGKGTHVLADIGYDAKGLQRMMLEFEDETVTSKWLRKNLEVVGFSAADRFGKDVLINSTYAELRKAAMSSVDSQAYKRLVMEYEVPYGKDFNRFVKALQSGATNDDNVLGAIYARVLEQHPISKSSMPLIYAKHPHARVMYQLSSFTIKQIHLLRTRTLDQIAEGVTRNDAAGNAMIKDGLQDMFKYGVLFGGSVQGINELKDFMLGREVELHHRAIDMGLNLFGLHRVHVERMRNLAAGGWQSMSFSERLWQTVGKTLTPPLVGQIEEIIEDITDPDLKRRENYGRKAKILGFETPIKDESLPYLKARSWRFVPGFGRDIFWSVGRGLDWIAKRFKQPKQPKKKITPSQKPRGPRPPGRKN